MTHRCIQLTSGEILVGKLESEDSSTITINHPMQVVYDHQVSDQGVSHNVAIFPYNLIVEDQVFQFGKQFVIYIKPIKEELKTKYEALIDLYANKRVPEPNMDKYFPEEHDQGFQNFMKKLLH